MSEAEKMQQMHAWLDDVCARLDVDRTTVNDVTPDMLDLIRQVAHGPSRPGAPMTAFLVGLAAGTTFGQAEVNATGEGGAAEPPQVLADLVRANITDVKELIGPDPDGER